MMMMMPAMMPSIDPPLLVAGSLAVDNCDDDDRVRRLRGDPAGCCRMRKKRASPLAHYLYMATTITTIPSVLQCC